MIFDIVATSSFADPTWNYLTGFYNGWENYGNPVASCSYTKDLFNKVHLRGVLKNGSLNSTIFFLPVDYRPAKDFVPGVLTSTGLGQINIRTTSGEVVLASGGTDAVVLDGLSWYAEVSGSR
jgi:hypothetical protein